ncbi:MAG: DUF1949 domain-containing protein, partial [Ignavibacteria bacterium]|nr:DUF1949 domain-containing protein [Ignavibacteria bacterium]
EAEIKKKYLYQKIFVKLDFQFAQKVYHIFNDPENKILNVNYTEQANFECLVKPGKLSQIIKNLNDLTHGMVEISKDEKIYF